MTAVLQAAHLLSSFTVHCALTHSHLPVQSGVTWDDCGMGSSGKKEYVRECVEGSLKRLGITCIDLYYQVDCRAAQTPSSCVTP